MEIPMNKLLISLPALAVFCCSSVALAQSSKATAQITTVSVCANSNNLAPCVAQGSQTIPTGVWHNVMTTSIKTSNIADLFVDTSLVTGLYTSTQVKGNGSGSTSTASAMGGVQVRAVMDPQFDGAGNVVGGTYAYPDNSGNGVTFDQRIQTLTANLGNIFTDCFANGGNTGTGCTLTQEQITLALDTTSAHSYNFILLNVGTGTHTLLVQAEVNTSATGSNGGVAISNAMFGLGSLTVESVRLVNSFSF
jgi:hypothetical protein